MIAGLQCGDLALAIALVSRWACAAMACAKCEGQFGGRYYIKMRRVGCIFFCKSL